MLSKFFASILVLTFINLFVFSLFLNGIFTSLLNEDLIKESLQKTNAYERALEDVLPDFIDNIPIENESLLTLLSKKEAQTLLVGIIKPKELQKLTEDTLDEVVPYLNSESNQIELTYNIRGYKNNFSSNTQKLLIEKFDQLPTCNAKQLQSLQKLGEGQVPKCKIVGQTGTEVYGQLGLSLVVQQNLNSLPDQILIKDGKVSAKPKGSLNIDQVDSLLTSLETGREGIANLYTARLISFIALSVLIVFIALIRFKKWRSVSTTIGWAFLLGGGSASLLSLIILWSLILTTNLSASTKIPESLALLVTDLSKEILKDLTNQIFFVAIPVLLIGVVLIILPLFFKKRSFDKPKNNS